MAANNMLLPSHFQGIMVSRVPADGCAHIVKPIGVTRIAWLAIELSAKTQYQIRLLDGAVLCVATHPSQLEDIFD